MFGKTEVHFSGPGKFVESVFLLCFSDVLESLGIS